MQLAVNSHPFGDLLKYWRKKRSLSQLSLAAQIETTSRHISFLETGRSKPSQNMILRLSDALDVPFRERNTLFKSAGFNAHYKLRELDNDSMEVMSHAIDLILNNHAPFPGFVLDRYWNLLKANEPGKRMMSQFISEQELASGTSNMLMQFFSNKAFQQRIENWPDVSRQLIQRIRRESFDDLESRELIERLRSMSDLPQDYWEIDLDRVVSPVIPMKIHLGDGVVISMISTITTFGTPVDVLSQEIRIELVFPADAGTEYLMRQQHA